MTDSSRSLNRRSFIKRFGGAVGVLTTISVIPKSPAAAAAEQETATASVTYQDAIERYTVLRWNGPADAVVQLRQLQLLGSWTEWRTVDVWTDTNAEGDNTPRSGLLRVNGAQALEARALTDGVTNLTIVPVSSSRS